MNSDVHQHSYIVFLCSDICVCKIPDNLMGGRYYDSLGANNTKCLKTFEVLELECMREEES